jgi:hypothetical protein
LHWRLRWESLHVSYCRYHSLKQICSANINSNPIIIIIIIQLAKKSNNQHSLLAKIVILWSPARFLYNDTILASLVSYANNFQCAQPLKKYQNFVTQLMMVICMKLPTQTALCKLQIYTAHRTKLGVLETAAKSSYGPCLVYITLEHLCVRYWVLEVRCDWCRL